MRADAARTDQQVFNAVVGFMRRRDRVCFASHKSIAAEAGCSTRTVKRSLQRLQQAGKIERCDGIASGAKIRTCVWRVTHGTLRKPKCPTTAFGRTTNYLNHPSCSLTTFESKKGGCNTRQRRRHQVRTDLVAHDGDVALPPDTAQSIVKDVIDAARATGIPVSRRFVGIIAQQVKELLADGFSGECLRQACAEALRQRRPHQLFWIASDLAVAQAGQLRSPRSYRQMLNAEAEMAEARDIRMRLFG